MKPNRVIAIVILLVAAVFWGTAISSASSAGFFEDEFAVQTMVLGGALSMMAGFMFFIGD